jgi:flavorubredoxin
MRTYEAATDIEVITSDIPIPGLGLIPVNAFVLKGKEPILVDTGTVVERDEFMASLRSVIDPAELRWIWLTHTDFDHIGSLHTLLAENPAIRVATTFLAVGIMGLADPLPMDRLHLLNPGQQLQIGERALTAFRPPAFDNPSTMGFIDESSGILFSADSFGALLQQVPDRAADLTDQELREGQVFWATVDSPWLQWVDERALARRLDEVRDLQPEMVLSSHLPAAGKDQTERLLASLAAAPKADPFVGMDQTALEQMLAEMTGAAPPA